MALVFTALLRWYTVGGTQAHNMSSQWQKYNNNNNNNNNNNTTTNNNNNTLFI